MRVINEFGAKYDVDIEKSEIFDRDLVKDFSKSLNAINDLTIKYDLNFIDELCHLKDWLIAVADVDNVYHTKEQTIMKLIREAIGIDMPIVRERFQWDEDQKQYLDSDIRKKIIVSAPPGAGKTHLISKKVIQLILDGINPRKIVLISFTNAAVNEMYSRIFELSEGKISDEINVVTLDSKIFHMNAKIFSNFEAHSYEQNLELFLNNGIKSHEFLEYWKSQKHIFIDEAQDLVDMRREICFELISICDNSTGVSVFGDPAQQIYPWNQASKSSEENMSLISQLDVDGDNPNNFEKINLRSIHRTKDSELLRIIDNMRQDIMLIEDDRLPNQISQFEHYNGAIENQISQNHLLLFRTHGELAATCHNLLRAGQTLRLRRPATNKYPSYLPKWIYHFIKYGNQEKFIKKEKFISILTDSSADISQLIEKDDIDYLWRRVCRYSNSPRDSDSIDIELYKVKISQDKKSLFHSKNFGSKGPLLSTIHSAKGSQADNVILHSYRDLEKEKIDQENAKIFFVGATRSRKSIKIRDTRDEFFKEKNTFKKYKKRHYDNPFQKARRYYQNIEIGIFDDYDPISIVSKKMKLVEVKKAQRFLEGFINHDVTTNVTVHARIERRFDPFKIFARKKNLEGNIEECCLGYFKEGLNKTISDIAYKANLSVQGYAKQEAIYIDLRIMDIATYVHYFDEDEDDPDIYSEYLEKGFWLYPILYSFGPVKYRTIL